MKQLFSPTLKYIGLSVIAILLMGKSQMVQSNKICKDVVVEILPGENNFFLDIDGIRAEVGASSDVLGQRIRNISLHEMESKLEQNAFIENAEVWIDNLDNLHLQAKFREPIARVIGAQGQDFYIDKNNLKMPICPNFSARCILIRGYFQEEVQDRDTLRHPYLREMLPIIYFLTHEPLFNAMVSEIVIDKNGEYRLLPQLGNMEIYFGKADRITEKFNVLLRFYKYVIPRVGWDYYTSLNLSYENQIIATKNNQS
ncbi:MAG: hypothetical protein LC115_02590 [Bacteroidia bacterium]|nr:hypothetical protein [Bacteroidia bacterium]